MSDHPDSDDIQAVTGYLENLQDGICAGLAGLDPAVTFREDAWVREGGGGGRTRVLAGGEVFESAAVNYSRVHGDALPSSATAERPQLEGRSFLAMGVSLVIHPRNPYVPTSHCNVRFFSTTSDDDEPVWWFGGGFDLTPYYAFEEDILHWHRAASSACEAFGEDVYSRYKAWCDEYFYLKHRNETRGVGGLFFDDLSEGGFERCFSFARSVGDHYLPAYLPIVERRRDKTWGERERDFQLREKQ